MNKWFEPTKMFVGDFPGGPEKEMATHSSTLAWKIPWTEEPGRLQSTGSQRVGHDWATSLSLSLVVQWLRIWLPMQGTQVRFLVWEDSACCGAPRPVHLNCWACVLQVLKPACLEPVLHHRRSHARRSLCIATRESWSKAMETQQGKKKKS